MNNSTEGFICAIILEKSQHCCWKEGRQNFSCIGVITNQSYASRAQWPLSWFSSIPSKWEEPKLLQMEHNIGGFLTYRNHVSWISIFLLCELFRIKVKPYRILHWADSNVSSPLYRDRFYFFLLAHNHRCLFSTKKICQKITSMYGCTVYYKHMS